MRGPEPIDAGSIAALEAAEEAEDWAEELREDLPRRAANDAVPIEVVYLDDLIEQDEKTDTPRGKTTDMTLPKESVKVSGYAALPSIGEHLVSSAVAQTSSGGDVQVRFENDHGTAFTVYLTPEDWKNIAAAVEVVYRPSQQV